MANMEPGPSCETIISPIHVTIVCIYNVGSKCYHLIVHPCMFTCAKIAFAGSAAVLVQTYAP
jgi:hypothetical protein